MITIRDIRTILTAPAGINLVVVKVETSEPGLYGLGCATFTQRYLAVATAVQEYLRPLMIGRDVDRTEEHFLQMMVHSYWRNGPVLNNAISGIDMALWDIRGKRAGLPLYSLLGGKCREAAAVYRHVSGPDVPTILEGVGAMLDQGVRHVRVQTGGYGGALRPETAGYGGATPATLGPPAGALDGPYYDPRIYTRSSLAAITAVREKFGDRVEVLHDIHERLPPAMAVEFAKDMDPLRLFFLEDPLAPEDLAWMANIRAACATPLAIGELFVHPGEWTPLIVNRQLDFIRMHVSAIGGVTPARKAAALAEAHGVRTAWHGPGDVSPVGHAVNVHLDLACPNFGIQEWAGLDDNLRTVFPGCPELRGGYVYLNDQPGIGVDVDEAAAARFPCKGGVDQWTQARRTDGSVGRP